MEVLNAELNRLRGEGADTTEIESAISARTQAYRNSILALEGEILQSSDFYDKLFGTVSDRGYKVLKDFYTQAQDTLKNAKVDGDGVEISIPVKDAPQPRMVLVTSLPFDCRFFRAPVTSPPSLIALFSSDHEVCRASQLAHRTRLCKAGECQRVGGAVIGT